MKLKFTVLNIYENNFLSWILDVEIHLEAMNLGETIKEENNVFLQDRIKAMIFIHYHLYKGLKIEWQNLRERYDHQKFIILSQARYDWLHLRLQDFKSVSEYNSAPFKITS
ncbi:hypothetical protein POPTR_015G070400v4 [Populus trichocarpa]|uniref:Uncharacterized protein n=1 Tax=Populus trichocarpa TaxID=3694 RepID=A0ACC0RVB7_POPTR|nr:hypothetical protein POPTR_015G070400v4 [Populus trichocarpa]